MDHRPLHLQLTMFESEGTSTSRRLIDWYLAFSAAVVAARGPVFAAVLFGVTIALPDQTVEAVRIVLAVAWYGALTAMIVWGTLCLYLSGVLIVFARPALDKASGGKLRAPHRALLILLFVLPPAAALQALEPVNSLYSIFWNDTAIFYENHMIRSISIYLLVIWISVAFARFKFMPAGEEWLIYQMSRTMDRKSQKVFIYASLLFVLWFCIVGLIQSAIGVPLEIPAVLFVTFWATVLFSYFPWLRSLPSGRRLPIFTTVVLWVGLLSYCDVNDNHEIRYVGSEPSNRTVAKSVDEAFRTWLDARKKGPDVQRPYPVFIVAAEGGGARAAYFAALVLEELRARSPRFLSHTFLITGVSGGSLGAALVAASAKRSTPSDNPTIGPRPPLACGNGRRKHAGLDSKVVRALSTDFLSPLIRGAMISDLLAQLVPTDFLEPDTIRRGFIYATDRARYLERALERAWQAETGRELGTFQSVWPGPKGEAPALMFLTTNVETGQRMAVSHLTMPRSPETQISCSKGKPSTTTASDEDLRSRLCRKLLAGSTCRLPRLRS